MRDMRDISKALTAVLSAPAVALELVEAATDPPLVAVGVMWIII